MTGTATAPRLSVRDLSVTYGALRAVDGVSFDVAAGAVVALIGPNGAGKTSAFNAITGYVPARAGSVRLDSKELLGRSPHAIARSGVARTFQRVSIFPRLTVRTNLEIAAGRSGRRRRSTADDADHSIESWAELAHVRDLDEPAGTLAYGSQRMLAVVFALARRPRVLLLDEPAAGLNATESGHLRTLIATARDAGTSTLLVEHDMRLVMRVSDHVVVMAHGRTIAAGDPADVQTDRQVVEAYLGRGRG